MELSVEPNAMSISEKLKGHTIVLSEDVKKLQEEPILPQVLMERYVIKTCAQKNMDGCVFIIIYSCILHKLCYTIIVINLIEYRIIVMSFNAKKT